MTPTVTEAPSTYPDRKILTYTYDFADRPVSVQQTGTGSAPQIRDRLAIDALMARLPSHAAPEAPRGRGPIGPALPVQRPQPLRAFSPRGPAGTAPGSEEAGVPERLRGKPVKPSAAKPAASSPTVFVSAAGYEPFGPIDSITYGNTTLETISYDNRYRVTENKLAAGTTLDDHAYGLDALGNITGLTDKLSAAYDRSFTYDDLNRLTTANSGTSLWGTATGNGYTYDAMGNLKTLQLGAKRSDTFTYLPGSVSSTGLPKLKSVLENGATRNVVYDPFGNELSDGKSSFSYSSRELLASDSSDVTTYYYDGFRRRTAATLTSALGGGTRETIFDTPMMRMLAETTITTGTPAIAYDYVWFAGRPVAQLSSAGTSWTYADHLGTPLLQTNGSDAVTWQAEHEPYGQVWALRAGDVHQPLRLPGQVAEQFDAGANGASELSYNLMRWYRPGWGRYAEPDLIARPPAMPHWPLALPGLRVEPQDQETQRELALDVSQRKAPFKKAMHGDPIGLGDPLGLLGGDDAYRYAIANPLWSSDDSGLRPKLPKPPRGRWLPTCNVVQEFFCEWSCEARGGWMGSCQIWHSYSYRIEDGVIIPVETQGKPSCSCDYPSDSCPA